MTHPTEELMVERLDYLADEAQDGTGFLTLDTASALELIAAARRGLQIQQLLDSDADLDAIADALKHPWAPDAPPPPDSRKECE